MIQDVAKQNSVRINTGVLNELLAAATNRVQPPSDKGKRLKIYYMTQASTKPPTFVAFVNRKELFHFSYQRYLENQIRGSLRLNGNPHPAGGAAAKRRKLGCVTAIGIWNLESLRKKENPLCCILLPPLIIVLF